MERYTKRENGGNAVIRGDGIYSDWGTPEGFRGDAIDRLAAYEDTGLEPEEICKSDETLRAFIEHNRTTEYPRTLDWLLRITKAEAEGRMIVLPCKVGDTVYTLDYNPCHYGETHPDSYSCEGCHDPCDIERAVRAIPVRDMRWILLNAWEIMNGKYFMSREEAEAALKGAEE